MCFIFNWIVILFTALKTATSFPTNSREVSLKVLVMNVWGDNIWGEEKETRMPKIAKFLENSNYDLVFIQEAWYYEDFEMLTDTFPYSTFYGSSGSLLCPCVNEKSPLSTLARLKLSVQSLPLDCNGLTILSKYEILDRESIFFKDRIPETREFFVRRGAFAIKIEVANLKISLINTHLATWHSESEEEWSSVRESQADDVIELIAAHEDDQADLIIVAGDLNSTPGSVVYNKFLDAGLTDSLVDLEGENSDAPMFVTWGHDDNTWTAGEPMSRVDHLLYMHSDKVTVRTTAYRPVNVKSNKNGEMMSLSDHMWAEANLQLSFD